MESDIADTTVADLLAKVDVMRLDSSARYGEGGVDCGGVETVGGSVVVVVGGGGSSLRCCEK